MRISDWSSDVCSSDLVTIADEAAERALAARLPALVPGSVLVGEEGVERDAGLLGLLQGDAPVWIVAPIDGTKNFAEGSERFAIMVALLEPDRNLAAAL